MADLKQTNIIGVGATPFSRLGPEIFLPHYKILTLKTSDEDEEIKKRVEIFKVDYSRENRKHLSTILEAIDKDEAQDFLRSLKNPYLYLYFANLSVEKFLNKKKINFVGTPTSKFFNLRSKVGFYRLLKKIGIKTPLHLFIKKKDLNHSLLRDKLGDFVIQRETRGGGKGTLFVFNLQDFEKVEHKFRHLHPEEELRATKYLSGSSPSMTVCITSSGAIHSPLQYQILSPKGYINSKLGEGRFAGHDWSGSDFAPQIQAQANELAQKLGEYLRGKYKGILGIDFILDEKKQELYPIECNPRLLGSFPVFPMIQERQNEPQILYYHFLANILPQQKLEIEKINQAMAKKKQGAQIMLYNRGDNDMIIKESMKTGIYKIRGREIQYLRPGYRLLELKNDHEFILTDGLLGQGTMIPKYKKIGRVLTLKSMLKNDKINLSSWICQILDQIYQKLEGGA